MPRERRVREARGFRNRVCQDRTEHRRRPWAATARFQQRQPDATGGPGSRRVRPRRPPSWGSASCTGRPTVVPGPVNPSPEVVMACAARASPLTATSGLPTAGRTTRSSTSAGTRGRDHHEPPSTWPCGTASIGFHLVKDVVDRVSCAGSRAAYLTQIIRDKLIDHSRYIRQCGDDMPEIRDRQWRAREKGKHVSNTQ